MDEVDDVDLVAERVAALDLGKAALEVCVCPHEQRPGRRMGELRGSAPPPHSCWRWWAGCGCGACSGR